MNLTLEDLTLMAYEKFSFDGFLKLKSMPRLKSLNLYYMKDDCEEIQNVRQHLPQLMIRGVLNLIPGTRYNFYSIHKEK